ncbi:hypothetical protein C8J56DRAFT_1111705 [Mycena floridula]|nr:hypothetical protein C8J56DRAFT_1111705 [Mycena floridula]
MIEDIVVRHCPGTGISPNIAAWNSGKAGIYFLLGSQPSTASILMLNLYRLANRIPSAARMSYALLPENTMKSVLEDHAKVQAAPKIYKDWKVYRDPPPDVHLVRFDNEKLQYHSYNPPKGYTAEEIMQFGRAKQYLTLERAQELIERMEMDGDPWMECRRSPP